MHNISLYGSTIKLLLQIDEIQTFVYQISLFKKRQGCVSDS